jgi:hypothetical protein
LAARISDEYPPTTAEDVRESLDDTAALKALGADDVPAPAHPAMTSVETIVQAVRRKSRRRGLTLHASAFSWLESMTTRRFRYEV